MGIVFTEGMHTGEFILSEQDGGLSRENVTIAASAAALPAGQVLGRIRGAVTSAALGTNTGNGVMGAVTAGAGAKEGDYKLTVIEPAANGGAFMVEDPDGAVVGHGAVAVAFAAGGLSFTLADGATDFVAGDGFDITVTAITYKYKLSAAAATDGSEVPCAILWYDTDASSADKLCPVATRGLFNERALTFGTGHTADSTREALQLLGIHLRSSIKA